MLRLANFSIRRPWPALIGWIVVAAVLTAIGTGLTGSLSPSKVVVPGTEASRAQQLSDSRFGASVLVPILLQGPKAQLDRQGPTVVALLSRRPDTRVMSAWDAGSTGKGLRPRPTQAMIVAAVAHGEKDMVETYQSQIENTVRHLVKAPVTAHISGQPTVDRAMKDAAVDTTRRAMFLTLPILFLLLLLGLRAPLAALVLTAFGATTVGMAFGVMTLVGKVIDTDVLAIAFGAFTGLALSVGFALMISHRFRELDNGESGDTRATSAQAAIGAVGSTGRAILFGGTALIVALILAAAFSSNEVLTSVGIGALICSALSIGAAVVVMPAVLVIMGHKMDTWAFPAPRPLANAWRKIAGGGAGWVQRNAMIAGAIATAVLVALAIPAFSIDTGPPGIQNTPSSSAAHKDFDAINKAMGAGWATPFNVLVSSDTKPLTDFDMLRRLDRFQALIAKDKRVASVVGPGEFRADASQLGKLPKSLNDSAKLLKGGKKDLGRLAAGLGQAGQGTVTLQEGLRAAASGAAQINGGSGDAEAGAGQLKAGLSQARSGATQISDGLGQALSGATSLKTGAAQALAGSKQITGGLAEATPTVKNGLPIVQQMASDVQAGSQAVTAVSGSAQTAVTQLDAALTRLQSMGTDRSDPNYQAAIAAIQQARNSATSVNSDLGAVQSRMQSAAAVSSAFAGQVGELSTGLQKLLAGSTALTDGISQLSAGNTELASGIAKLNGGGGALTGGLTQLRDGAAALQSGLGMLTSGSGQLATSLAAGVNPVSTLTAGLSTMHAGVAKFRNSLPSPRDIEQLNAQSPGLFDSGYFVLAAIAGAPASQRNLASFAVNVDRGATAGQIVVIPKYPPSDKRTQALGDDLSALAHKFAEQNGLQVAVGGPAGQLGDFEDQIGGKIWPVIIIIGAVIALMLMLMLRAVPLPGLSVLFDLLTVAATFGVLTQVFTGGDPLFGGPGYLDPVTIIMVFAAVFGLSMVYEVYLLEMSRESFVRDGDPHKALRSGLRQTAAAATGSGVVAVAAAIPFIASNLINLRQVGLGVAIAILLDTFLVRPVLLPAAMELCGRRGWWPTRSRAADPGYEAPSSAATSSS